MNRAILLGRLVRDPELRTTQNGHSVCSFTLAIDRRFKNQQGERETDFIPCVAWGKTAEFCERYFSQGQRMALLGSIQRRSWEDNEGKRQYMTEVVAEEIYFADSKRESSGGQTGNYDNRNYGNRSYGGSSYGGGREAGDQRQSSGGSGFETAGSQTSGQAADEGFFPAPDDDTSLPFDL